MTNVDYGVAVLGGNNISAGETLSDKTLAEDTDASAEGEAEQVGMTQPAPQPSIRNTCRSLLKGEHSVPLVDLLDAGDDGISGKQAGVRFDFDRFHVLMWIKDAPDEDSRLVEVCCCSTSSVDLLRRGFARGHFEFWEHTTLHAETLASFRHQPDDYEPVYTLRPCRALSVLERRWDAQDADHPEFAEKRASARKKERARHADAVAESECGCWTEATHVLIPLDEGTD